MSNDAEWKDPEETQPPEQALPENDPAYAEALLNAGANATFEGKYEEADRLLARALDATLKIHGEKSLQTLFALTRVCIIKRQLGKFAEAQSAIERALAGARECFPHHRLYPWALENLAILREVEGKTGDAERIFAEAIVEYERVCGFPSHETAEGLSHQCASLLRMGKLRPAELAMRRVIGAMDEIKGLSGYGKSDYLAALAGVLEEAGSKAEAAEMRERARQLLERAKRQSESEE
ncbi:MAG TPA: tetratricopeptide repeat protein [Candidatus Acidoferrales bacterium]|nr:tetratricopeptide repeat protein [Candidatus Acidoferrales bacterium]